MVQLQNYHLAERHKIIDILIEQKRKEYNKKQKRAHGGCLGS